MSNSNGKFTAGLDIGNGYVKGGVTKDGTNFVASIDLHSCVAYHTAVHDIKAAPDEVADIIDNIYNKMEISFDSPLVTNGTKRDTTRRLFGERALLSKDILDEFDVFSPVSKAKQPLSFVLTFGCLAGAALQEFWASNKRLPDEKEVIKVDCVIALALPIDEFKKYKDDYAAAYCSAVHKATFYNFETPVNVELNFAKVQIVAEGASAQYAIKTKGVDFMNAMLTDVRSHGLILDGITAQDVFDATNTVGIDIGEGTVNFPVFQNGKFNPDVSSSLPEGYGSVLNATRERLLMQGISIGSRRELQEFLTKQSAIKKNIQDIARQIEQEEIEKFVLKVGIAFSNIMSNIHVFNEVVYVYGGGSGPLKDALYPILIEKVRDYDGENSKMPILYLDPMYSRFLNREGLYSIAQAVAAQGKKK
jgi:plasmid segregation protein ParM